MKKVVFFVIVGVIASVVIGFWVGSKVAGSSFSPGSVFDPLVTQSYADKSVDERVKELETKLADLEVKTQVLENELLTLMGEAGLPTDAVRPSEPVNPTAPSASNPSNPAGTVPTPVPPTTTPVVPVDVIGKTARVSVDSVVNLRQSPNTSSTVVRRLVGSDTFTIVKVDNDWYQVQLPDGSTGWVAGWLVTAQ
ncbi:MAG: SH3 domain-containing protein [Peptococcaceae bacterium]|jgi:uncharacterized protein YgiM (DUF1202 family)|nr:SH3 domain-containing protein [Peptococcaceae bacterium]